MRNFEKGQVVVVLLLAMLVGLSIGLVITQKTITEVTTSTQTEQASRAFSAAEAGIERALSGATGSFDVTTATLGNDASARVTVDSNYPSVNGQALELPNPINKANIAQFWLVDPETFVPTSPASYPSLAGASLSLYFGNKTDTPAAEVKTIYYESGQYKIRTNYIDTDITGRTNNNNFTACNVLNPSDYKDYFACKHSFSLPPGVPVMMRVRLLYSDNGKVALKPDATHKLPPQAAIYNSTGYSGQSQKTISMFAQKKYLSPLLDYVLFSADDITK